MKQLIIKDGNGDLKIHQGRSFQRNTVFWINEPVDNFSIGSTAGIVLNPAQLLRLRDWVNERVEELFPQEYNQF